MFIVYVLRSETDGGLYVGLTGNLDRRLKQHNRGHERSTKSRRPFVLLLSEHFESRAEARAREQYYKSGSGREILKTTFRQ